MSGSRQYLDNIGKVKRMSSSNQDAGFLAIIKWATEYWSKQYKDVYEFKLFQVSDGLIDIALS